MIEATQLRSTDAVPVTVNSSVVVQEDVAYDYIGSGVYEYIPELPGEDGSAHALNTRMPGSSMNHSRAYDEQDSGVGVTLEPNDAYNYREQMSTPNTLEQGQLAEEPYDYIYN